MIKFKSIFYYFFIYLVIVCCSDDQQSHQQQNVYTSFFEMNDITNQAYMTVWTHINKLIVEQEVLAKSMDKRQVDRLLNSTLLEFDKIVKQIRIITRDIKYDGDDEKEFEKLIDNNPRVIDQFNQFQRIITYHQDFKRLFIAIGGATILKLHQQQLSTTRQLEEEVMIIDKEMIGLQSLSNYYQIIVANFEYNYELEKHEEPKIKIEYHPPIITDEPKEESKESISLTSKESLSTIKESYNQLIKDMVNDFEKIKQKEELLDSVDLEKIKDIINNVEKVKRFAQQQKKQPKVQEIINEIRKLLIELEKEQEEEEKERLKKEEIEQEKKKSDIDYMGMEIIEVDGVKYYIQGKIETKSKDAVEGLIKKAQLDNTKSEDLKKRLSTPKLGFGEYEYSDTKVVELNGSNFERALEENDYVFVLFYAPWCSRSQTLSVEFDGARALYNHSATPFTKRILFARVNCFVHTDVRDRQSIGGYPVIQMYRRRGGNVIPRGPTHPDTLAAAVGRHTLNTSQEITNVNDFHVFLKIASSHAVIGLFSNTSSDSFASFSRVAKKIGYRTPIAYITNPLIISFITDLYPGSSSEGVLQIFPLEKRFNFLSFVPLKTSKSFFNWLITSKPLINELTPESVHRFTSSNNNNNNPNVVLFIDYTIYSTSTTPIGSSNKPLSPELLQLYQLLNQNINSFNFFFTDSVSYRDFNERLGINEIPGLVIIDIEYENHYIYNIKERGEMTKQSIQQFFDDFKDGKLIAFKDSENEIESIITLNNPIIKVVHSNFNQLILNNSKFTLINLNAQWCGFSKIMKLYFENATNQLLNNYKDDLQVVEYNVVENSIPDIIKPFVDGYPTILLIWPGTSLEPSMEQIQVYKNYRGSNNLIQFVGNHITQHRSKLEKDDTTLELQSISIETLSNEVI